MAMNLAKLRDLGVSLIQQPTWFCDNSSTLSTTVNLVFHARTKHIEIYYHFMREKVVLGSLVIRFVPSKKQIADRLTQPPSKVIFQYLRSKLSLWHLSPVSHGGGGG